MPIVLCDASKATPYKGLAYILDKEKTLAAGNQGFATLANDPKALAEQMMFTMTIHGKGGEVEERKYYHCKVSFHPDDLPENGGTLTVKKAYSYAMEYAAATWPGREVVWSIQKHGRAMHIHFIVAAVEQATGKKMDARDAEYRRWKKRANDLAMKHGLSTLDWEAATKAKRAGESMPDLPVLETFAETDMKSRGKSTWKDDLRSKIDAAAKTSRTMDEFKAALQKDGVTLTRCTEQTISYKLGDHKACRGDTLGADYTVASIRSVLQLNAIEPAPEEGKAHVGIDAAIGHASQRQATVAAGGRDVSKGQRDLCRELGRLAGVPRAEVDRMIDDGAKATWDEKQAAWEKCKAARNMYWEEYTVRQQALRNELDEAYKARRKVKNAEWALNPRNRRSGLLGALYGFAVLSSHDDLPELERRIAALKKEQAQLRQEVASFKKVTERAVGTLREKNLSLDAYMDEVTNMQIFAKLLAKKNGLLDEKERADLLQQAGEARKKYQKENGR